MPTPNPPRPRESDHQNAADTAADALLGARDATQDENLAGHLGAVQDDEPHSCERFLAPAPNPPTPCLGSSPPSPSPTPADDRAEQTDGDEGMAPNIGQARTGAASDLTARTGEPASGSNMSTPASPAGAEKKRAREVSIAQGSPQVMTSPIQQYRERLARDLERREMAARGSPPAPSVDSSQELPDREESATSATTPKPGPDCDLPTTSTESDKTVRGGLTPGPTPGAPIGTPSYPFPRMQPSDYLRSSLQEALMNRSQSGMLASPRAQFGTPAIHDSLRSDPSTPASTMTFAPTGATPMMETFDLPTPNLYDLTLMLTAEPGLDPWWSTVVQIMKEHYKAERVTLSIPADTTDLDNVPWGQKATYNLVEEDELSMGYIARGTSRVPNSFEDVSELASATGASQKNDMYGRPGISNRHSFTSYEAEKETRGGQVAEDPRPAPARPNPMPRSKSYFPTTEKRGPSSPGATLNQQNLQKHDAVEERHSLPVWETQLAPRRDVKGRVLPVLQGLDMEADPLIDHDGVKRVVERGKVIALTRNYPYLEQEAHRSNAAKAAALSEDAKKKSKKPARNEMATQPSYMNNVNAARSQGRGMKAGEKPRMSLKAMMHEEEPRPPTPKYEEYEQAPPSPWSQSPAPSPAVRAEPKENPFFTDAMVDEESFNPGPGPHDYTNIQVPETIGVDNSWTVLHVPLAHILLSKANTTPGFKLNSAALEEKTALRGRTGCIMESSAAERSSSPDSSGRGQQKPIAILSILSPIIPYPSNLRHSLERLAPHLATSFLLARHYSNLETELSGLHRKRPSTAGFGAVGPDGRPMADPLLVAQSISAPSETPSQQSATGSITSPSDYSVPTRSAAASPLGTPSWDSGGPLGLVVERRPAGSPGQTGGDGYFNSISKATGASTTQTTPATRIAAASKETAPSTGKHHSRSSSLRTEAVPPTAEPEEASKCDDVLPATTAMKKRLLLQDPGRSSRSEEPSSQLASDERRKRPAEPYSPGQKHNHTMLHSYGADIAATLQSLPSGSLISHAQTPTSTAQRTSSGQTTKVTMLRPSDRLKDLMLDLLPAQVFVALPETGEIVWVNSRYLSYRGQTVENLVDNPWGSLHPDDRDEYLRQWARTLHTGDSFDQGIRLRRFDGVYRHHQARAVAARDKRGVIRHFIGSYMDIHKQRTAEVKAARQEEIASSEAKHRLLANLIPQIIFSATEDEGITFANDQWQSYTGQSMEDSMGLGFMDFVHPEDLARCKLPTETAAGLASEFDQRTRNTATPTRSGQSALDTFKRASSSLSRNGSSGSSSASEITATELTELAKNGVIKVTTDGTGRLSYTTEVRLRSKTGDYRWHLIRCVEVDNINFGNGDSSFFGSATDINDHKLLEAKLKEAMESKSRFLSNMSHEIRTPLIGISGMVSFLQDTVLNEEQRDYTNTIQTSANSLLMIINDILDLSKVDAGMMKLNFEWFHTRSLIEDVNELVSTMAIAKRLELNYVVEENVPSWVKGDKVRIRQVLLNVIGNAIKFTPTGEVFSRCRVLSNTGKAADEHEIMLEFSIVDTGRGFTKEEAELIFKPFSQIDGSSTRQHGGSGLGLVISRQLVELHGGRMDGSAIPGKGSTFTFSARFGLPTEADYPEVAGDVPAFTPALQPTAAEINPDKNTTTLTMQPRTLLRAAETAFTASPQSDVVSPTLTSSGSSNPSTGSARSRDTARSSVSSVNVGLVHFSEAARASGQELSEIKLELPPGKASHRATPPPGSTPASDTAAEQLRPPMYSILIICPQNYSREATTKHIEMTLPKDVPHQITAMASVAEAQKVIGGDESVTFTHIVLNLPSAMEIISVVDQIMSSSAGRTSVLILSDSVQRQDVLKLASDPGHQRLLEENRVVFVYKPVKPSRFAAVFDPSKSRDLSVDRNRSTAAQMVESQKQSYLDVERRIGNKGYKVLLVEDNPVNQKVLVRYLKKVGIAADIAADGVECTDAVFSHQPGYYSLILCDLHMPRKDGYQACREIRQWETSGQHRRMPIIALSANVMSDVQEKCSAAGFSAYVTKPVDFVDLSTAMSKFF